MTSQIPQPGDTPARRARWLNLRLAIGIIMSIVVAALVALNYEWILDAVSLAREAQPVWLAAAFALILASYLVSSQVFYIVLRSLGYRVSALRLWFTTIVAILLSQSIPAGGVGSYAFLMSTFRRHGVSGGQAALIASLEALSYGGAMLLFGAFSLAYLTTRTVGSGISGVPYAAPLLAGAVAALVIGGAVFVLTRSQETLTRWLLAINTAAGRLMRRPLDGAWVARTVDELARGRALIVAQRSRIALLVLIQLVALSGHSLAMLLILWSLGVQASVLVVLAAFGVALIVSTFNVLPGGGGTVEAVLAAVLTQLVFHAAAVPAAIIFRLLNLWLLIPVAAAGYYWLMHRRPVWRRVDHGAEPVRDAPAA